MGNMIDAYKKFLSNYANFNNRSTRSDFWYVILVNYIISTLLGLIGSMLPTLSGLFTTLGSLYTLAVLIPSIALVVRRLHDINRPGWNLFVALIPIAGIIILLIYLCTDSVNDNNQYGPRV